MDESIEERIAKRAEEIRQQRAEEERTAIESCRNVIAAHMSEEIQEELDVRFIRDEESKGAAEFVLEGYSYIVMYSTDVFFIKVMNPDGSLRHEDSIFTRINLVNRIVEIAAHLHLDRTPNLS